jgi:hypothetical protein
MLPRRLGLAVLGAGAVLAVAGVVFYTTQNASARIGGAVAPQKVAWLAYAILLWFVLPFAIALDRRLAGTLRTAFGALLVFMLARGLIELWMLYVSLNWSPWYGIAHDLACIALLAGFGVDGVRRGMWRQAPNGIVLVHLAVTASAFVPEIHFAHYMTQHFDTTGDAAVYFVPDAERHGAILARTGAVVLALSIYLPAFLWGWLVGTARSKHTPAF